MAEVDIEVFGLALERARVGAALEICIERLEYTD